MADTITYWDFTFSGEGGIGTLTGSGVFTVDTNGTTSVITAVTASITDTYLPGFTGTATNVTPLAAGTVSDFGYSNNNLILISGSGANLTATLSSGGVAFTYDNGETLYLTSLFVDAYKGYSGDQREVSSEIITFVPEPGTLLLLGTGILGLAGLLRFKFVGSH